MRDASFISGLARASTNGPGILYPIAGTTPRSGTIRFETVVTGTVSPWEVFTLLRAPTRVTSKRNDVRAVISASSFAVLKASIIKARPVSKTPSSARICTLMANTISKLSILTIAVFRLGIDTSIHNICLQEDTMVNVGLFVRLEAKPGKEKAVADFLETGVKLAKQEPTTAVWFALKLGPSTFGVFDAFADEKGRQTHLNGPIAKALMDNAPALFSKAPQI